MGRFADRDWPILDAVVTILERRVPEFDREVIEDLIEAVGPEVLYGHFLLPAIDNIAERIGFPVLSGTEERGQAVHKAIEQAGQQALTQAQRSGKVALVNCECPHCNHTFLTTLESIVNREIDRCPSCEKQIVPQLVPGGKGAPESEPPTNQEGGP